MVSEKNSDKQLHGKKEPNIYTSNKPQGRCFTFSSPPQLKHNRKQNKTSSCDINHHTLYLPKNQIEISR